MSKTSPSAAIMVGKKIPDQALLTTEGPKRLKDFKGQIVVLYFYPKDDTSGCTQEGLDFNALHATFKKHNAVILGVSPDSLVSHEKFRKKHGFKFDLIADEERALCQAFGVWVKKSMYGREYMGVERSTFLIDAAGKLHAEWRKVKVTGHAKAVLDTLTEIE